MKLFGWVIELRLRRKENKQRIKYLLEKLVSELEQQGYDVKSTTGNKDTYFSIFRFNSVYSITGHKINLELEDK
jgi:hypothetical protein